MKNQVDQIITKLKKKSSQNSLQGMASFGIDVKYALGVSMPEVRKIAKEIGKDHILAQKLWQTKIHEARILASIIDDPSMVNSKQMDTWINGFNSWDICDQCCMNLFSKISIAFRKAKEWSQLDSEFKKRAGFALMASLAVHDKKAENKKFLPFLKIIQQEAKDERNFVKKAVNWALRQIGKRNLELNYLAIQTAEKILKQPYKSSQWIAKDALRELRSSQIQARLKRG